jgi:hypothetical protein
MSITPARIRIEHKNMIKNGSIPKIMGLVIFFYKIFNKSTFSHNYKLLNVSPVIRNLQKIQLKMILRETLPPPVRLQREVVSVSSIDYPF